jgi:hypothetical protein
MITHDIDPSLCAGEPLLETLDDGFSPPQHEPAAPPGAQAESSEPAAPALGPKSPF